MYIAADYAIIRSYNWVIYIAFENLVIPSFEIFIDTLPSESSIFIIMMYRLKLTPKSYELKVYDIPFGCQ
jgi:hypothetical protein